jgi:hypothetical protein
MEEDAGRNLHGMGGDSVVDLNPPARRSSRSSALRIFVRARRRPNT